MNKTTFYIFLFTLFSFSSFAQYENFEGTAVPAGGNWVLNSGTWKVFDNGIGLAQSWSVIPSPSSCNGRSAYLNKEPVTNGTFAEDWLVTPQVLIPTNGQLRFSTKQALAANFGSIYTIRVSTVSQTDVASFTTIQTWDETDLNTVYNVCEEKIVSLSAFAGLQVYVAFVMTNNNGDRWIIDDVDFAEQCLNPINLTATNNTTTSADLSWTNPSSATQWEVEVIPAGTNPSGTGIITTSIPYTITGLTLNTCYDYYVRSLCTSIYKSEWVGPFNFCTLNIGSSCAEPFPVSYLPFQSTGSTAYHSDLIDGIPGSSGCGTTGNFLDGNDVFYSFTATSSNSLTITSETNSTWSGLFVYNSCSNVGVSCVAGNTSGNGTTNPDTITFIPTIGQTYIIVISTFGTPQTVPYILTILENSCINLIADFQTVSNCSSGSDTFFINANITNMGTATSIVGSTVPVSTTQTISNAGYLQFGPFANGTSVQVHLQNQQDVNCSRTSTILTQLSCCTYPNTSFDVISNCSSGSETFFVTANVSNMGSATSIEGTTIPASTSQTLTSAGQLQFGPFQNGTNVILNLQNQQDVTCYVDSSVLTFLSCHTMLFKTFLDLNNDSVKQANEPNFTNGTFISNKNNSLNPIFTYSPYGNYLMYPIFNNDLIDVSFTIDSQYNAYFNSPVLYNDISVSGSASSNTYYFPITITTPFSDIDVNVIAISAPRPNFTFKNRIIYKNNGVSSTNGTITFTKDPNVSINATNYPSALFTSTGFSLDYTNLNPQETRYVDVLMYVPNIPYVNLGDLLTNSVTVTTTTTDIDLLNNTSSLSQVVIGSYDPNDKMEAHGETININSFTADDYLYYTIRFQNTGTADAINVEIQDALNSQLNPTTLRMIDASHDYVLIKNNNQLTWKFADINLPSDSVSEELSQGYVSFKIKPNPGFVVNDMIPNTAEIYFDFNPAIITNTFQTTF
ncbi:MAG: putative repeat protein (TIGR01451 family), partial [Flavobacterium sp.]